MSRNIDDTKILADKYFNFLVTDFGFDKPTEKWVSYEFHIEYFKDNIEIDIAIEAGGASLPWVTLTDHAKPFDLDMSLTSSNYYYIESLEDNETITNIHNARNERYNPKLTQFVKEYKSDNYNQTHAALDADYETWGRKELETLLSESAEIIKRHKQILQGDLTTFPKREQPSEIKLDIYEPTNNGAKKVKQQMFKSVSDLFNFIKGKRDDTK